MRSGRDGHVEKGRGREREREREREVQTDRDRLKDKSNGETQVTGCKTKQ